MLQVLTEADPRSTVVSIDGVEANDSISRKAMLEALTRVPGGPEVLPLCPSLLRATFSVHLGRRRGLSTESGKEKGENKGLLLRPFCSPLDNMLHWMLGKARMAEGEVVFLDDVYDITKPDRCGDVYQTLQEELYTNARVRMHVGKTQVWNVAGERPEACDVLERIAQAEDPRARVWKGSNIPTSEQGVRVLGTLWGMWTMLRHS